MSCTKITLRNRSAQEGKVWQQASGPSFWNYNQKFQTASILSKFCFKQL